MGFRARELFYYLKVGQVDYGEDHSKAYGHSQFGRTYEQGQKIFLFVFIFKVWIFEPYLCFCFFYLVIICF